MQAVARQTRRVDANEDILPVGDIADDEGDASAEAPVDRKEVVEVSPDDLRRDADAVELDPGELFGLVGSDGAGKTTTMRMLASIMEPTSGDAWVMGRHVSREAEAVKEHIGYMSQRFGLYPDLTVQENIRFYADIYGLSRREREEKIDSLLAFSNLTPFGKRKAGNLSGGMKQKLGLACALVHTPKVLLLDEPTNDLDIVTLNVLEEYLANFKGCVIVVSHDRYFMDKVVDHLMVFEGNAKLKDFPGNYTDYREWKELKEKEEKQLQAERAKKEEKPAASNKPARPVDDNKKKLSFKEKREFEQLEAEIPQLESEKAQLEQEMSSGMLSTDDLLTKSARISELIDLIDEKSMRWLELSEMA